MRVIIINDGNVHMKYDLNEIFLPTRLRSRSRERTLWIRTVSMVARKGHAKRPNVAWQWWEGEGGATKRASCASRCASRSSRRCARPSVRACVRDASTPPVDAGARRGPDRGLSGGGSAVWLSGWPDECGRALASRKAGDEGERHPLPE